MKDNNRNGKVLELLDVIRTEGLDNVSVLSEKVGIPVESARYMIWHEFPKHFISFDIDVDIEGLGLGTWLIEFTPSRHGAQSGIFGGAVGITYTARVLPGNSYVAFVAAPFGNHYKLWIELERLVKDGSIQNYSLTEVKAMRNISLNPSFYSFTDRKWNFTWKEVEAHEKKIGEARAKRLPPLKSGRESKAIDVDYRDLLILREFQKRIPKSISKLEKPLEIDQYNIRYHYNQHVRHAILGYRAKVIPEKPREISSFLFLLSQLDDDSLAKARCVALSLPFVDYEWKTEKEYGWHVSCPGEYSNELLRHLAQRLAEFKGDLRFLALDSMSEYRGTIPVQSFDEKTQTWNYEPKISSSKPYASFQELRNSCEYEAEGDCLVNELDPKKCVASICPFAAR